MAINLKDYEPALMQGANIDISLGDVIIDDLTVGDDATISGDLAVTGTSALTGNLAVGSDKFNVVAASGNTQIDGTLSVDGAADFDGAVSILGATNFKRQVTDTGGVFATPIVLTAAQSGRTILLDDAAGLDFTLPSLASAADIGTHFLFLLTVEPTSNSYRFTAASGDVLSGHIIIYDKDLAEGSTEALQQIFQANGSSHLVVTITGTDDTQGSLIGGWLEFTAISATGWFVRGSLIGDGALATPFS